MRKVFFYETIIGKIGIAENGIGITNIFFNEIDEQDDFIIQETLLIKEGARQIVEFLTGKRKTFDVPLYYIKGTAFQKSVWEALKTIPYGETRSYKEIAEQVGLPKACRAVGMANNKNPIPIIIPCHRVIGANGRLVGYGGGIEIKEKLLYLEQLYK